MSQINVDTIGDRTGSISTPAEDVIRGSARAFVNFNGTGTVAIRAAYNVSSITDNGTGVYTVNFTNAMPDANYSVAGSRDNLVNGSASSVHVSTDVAPTTSLVKVVTSIGTGAPSDSSRVCVAIFR